MFNDDLKEDIEKLKAEVFEPTKPQTPLTIYNLYYINWRKLTLIERITVAEKKIKEQDEEFCLLLKHLKLQHYKRVVEEDGVKKEYQGFKKVKHENSRVSKKKNRDEEEEW